MTVPNLYVTGPDYSSFKSVEDIQPLPLYPGEQIWRLIRGNDGARELTREQVVGEVVQVMRWSLSHARGGGAPWELISTGRDEYTLGDARPLRVEGVSTNPSQAALPKGKTYGRREQYPGDGLPTVIASDQNPPRYVTVRFWWRGKAGTSAAWPALGFGTSDAKVSQLGWMLDAAVVPDVKSPDPGDKSWIAAKAEDVVTGGSGGGNRKTFGDLADALVSAVKLAAALGAGYVAFKVYKGLKE